MVYAMCRFLFVLAAQLGHGLKEMVSLVKAGFNSEQNCMVTLTLRRNGHELTSEYVVTKIVT